VDGRNVRLAAQFHALVRTQLRNSSHTPRQITVVSY
jgi:hypothetical protein